MGVGELKTGSSRSYMMMQGAVLQPNGRARRITVEFLQDVANIVASGT